MRAHPDEHPEDEPAPRPLTAEEVRRLRELQPPLAAWKVVVAQLGIGSLVALAAAGVSGDRAVGWSVAYGAVAVALPAAMFARALVRGQAAGAAGAGFLVGYLVKIFLTVALLLAAPRFVPGLNWLGLLGGVVVATKMYWVALAAMRRSRRNAN